MADDDITQIFISPPSEQPTTDKLHVAVAAEKTTVAPPKGKSSSVPGEKAVNTPVNDKTLLAPRGRHTPAPPPVIHSDDKTRVLPPQPPTQIHSQPINGVIDVGAVIKERFVLDKLLGVGGMGAVYRALDLRKQEAGDDRPYVALKLLGEEFKEHPQAFVTLQREAKKTQDLAHPNIVTVYDFDRDGDLVYLTMEELKGFPLNDVLAGSGTQEPLDYHQKITMIREIAEGLAYAHSKGIVHSDLKPANLFVSDAGHVKILDFGIARAVNEELYQDSFDAGELGALTFTYASPEMINFGPPHPSDDIYALGVIACEVLGETHPFDGQDALRAQEKNLSPKLPKLRNPLLKKVLIRSLAFERKDRIADAGLFLRQLNFALSGPRRIALATALVLLVAVGNLIYLQTAMPPEGPPFSSLSAEAQATFKNYLSESETALRFGDVQGAVFNIDNAYQIHHTNDDIKKAIAQVTKLFEVNIRQAKDEQAREFYQQQWEQLQRYAAFSKVRLEE